ncbi:hypothetical protein CEXT_614461 [Caerostris extrusa]|uniref:Uncharacterized protein n=1 Tax=Caerostris extrusa TaxID=172846 RepID=A0AAV4TGP4_CAEEX|nr:hypothetical protein CEXT_614461 [Caerostris extrusa]
MAKKIDLQLRAWWMRGGGTQHGVNSNLDQSCFRESVGMFFMLNSSFFPSQNAQRMIPFYIEFALMKNFSTRFSHNHLLLSSPFVSSTPQLMFFDRWC